MYIYLSKKVSMPNNTLITACSWNREQGYIAAGGMEGLVKVIKLEMTETKDPKAKQPSGQTNLVMNQSLEGHRGSIACVAWNEQFDKLTTADTNGMIIVWMNHESLWYEEMINNRNKSVVKSMKWNSDGQQICIVYEDGAIIVGSVEGTRIWAKDLKNTKLTQVEWSPDSRLLLFGMANGEVHIYDANGNFMNKLTINSLEGVVSSVVSIDWYDGRNGFISPDSPALAICHENGRCQIMAHEADEKPVLMDSQMLVISAQWNHDGSILAIAGVQVIDEKEINVIQFYNPWGKHLKSLKVPGKRISSCSWEGGSLRIAITIDAFIYFANIRPEYKWGYFNNTIAYGFCKPGKLEQCVMFFNLKNGECNLKYVKQLLQVIAGGDYCVLLSRLEDAAGPTGSRLIPLADLAESEVEKSGGQNQFLISLCNAIGAPLQTKILEFEPAYSYMNSSHIIFASKSHIYIWNYQSSVERSSLKRQTHEKIIFIDNPNSTVWYSDDSKASTSAAIKPQNAKNPITCITASDKFLFIGRESGEINKYSFTTSSIVETLNMEGNAPPQKLFVNYNSTRLAVIDISNTLKLISLDPKQQKPELTNFKRSDVWNVLWASDNQDMFATMEKTRMYIFKDLEPEEPTSCTGYIFSFADLQVKVALLDDIMKRPENPDLSDIIEYDTKVLREARELLEGVSLQDASQFIEHNPHQRLWRLLTEASLAKLDLKTSEYGFVKCKDYYGIEFVKKLQNLNNQSLKRAEIAAFINNFDEAESIYLETDRKDLAYQLRRKLGDWFKVLQLLKNGSSTPNSNINALENDTTGISAALTIGTDAQLEESYNGIGDYYRERQQWSQAIPYYVQGRNLSKLADCYYILEEFDSLTKILDQLTDNHESLPKLGQMFESVGMCSQACLAYLKANNVKAAVDACIRLNQWDEGVRLAKQYNLTQVDQLLAKQANSLLEQNKLFDAIELYRKARHYLDAARLMSGIADKESKKRNSPLLIKKLYVLSGLLFEQYKELMKTGGILAMNKPKTQKEQASKALEGLLSEESQTAITDTRLLDNAWRGAEAYHFLMLTQRQLRAGNIEAAFKTSMALMEYEDILNVKHIYSLIALCACGNGSYNAASKAFVKLESSDFIESKEQTEFETLAFQIFSANPPKDKKPALRGDCPQCGHHITEWCVNCPNCDTKFPPCIVSGRPILEPQFRVCATCKHRAIEMEMENRVSCPLCHAHVK